MCRGCTMALTLGGLDQDLEQLSDTNIKRPMFSLDADMKIPNLKVLLLLAPNQLN